jgi:hypothetical protein
MTLAKEIKKKVQKIKATSVFDKIKKRRLVFLESIEQSASIRQIPPDTTPITPTK